MTFTKAFRTKAYEPHSKSVFHACKSSRAQHEFYTAEHRCFTQILNILFPSLLIQKLFLVTFRNCILCSWTGSSQRKFNVQAWRETVAPPVAVQLCLYSWSNSLQCLSRDWTPCTYNCIRGECEPCTAQTLWESWASRELWVFFISSTTPATWTWASGSHFAWTRDFRIGSYTAWTWT